MEGGRWSGKANRIISTPLTFEHPPDSDSYDPSKMQYAVSGIAGGSRKCALLCGGASSSKLEVLCLHQYPRHRQQPTSQLNVTSHCAARDKIIQELFL